MMEQVFLDLPNDMHRELWAHLVPEASALEEVAFVYARAEHNGGSVIFHAIEWEAVPPEGFIYQTEVGFELTDEMRGSVIKRAHNLDASLVEFHSHTGHWPAMFSPSDRYGFSQFVPHVWWRLKGRPYAAVIVTRSDFDGFAWVTSADSTQRLDGIVIGEQITQPTRLSSLILDIYDE
ncbi:MAG TPA: hypothetical protein VNI77_02090 [Nitrososphaera sp.]|nr:hypothetical protein [Nitrososphaera sp.]